VCKSITGIQGYRDSTGVQDTGVVEECWVTVVVQVYRTITGVQS
jgi:hypothetical protein